MTVLVGAVAYALLRLFPQLSLNKLTTLILVCALILWGFTRRGNR